ncbi:hypothetical protein F5146DRAFT_1063417 [Armillaria mellea]|nr:hypothetical protein F5146DRAFT_1063417 [Armillaria mellea]
MGWMVSAVVVDFLPFFLVFCFWGVSGIRSDLTGLISWLSWRRGRRVVFKNLLFVRRIDDNGVLGTYERDFTPT